MQHRNIDTDTLNPGHTLGDDCDTEWEEDGDGCNDCGEPAAYDEESGWYYHINPEAPDCFLMRSGKPEKEESMKESITTTHRAEFLKRVNAFAAAGFALVDVWEDADEVAPLPEAIRPPLSLDEWLTEFRNHYEEALAPGSVSFDQIVRLVKAQGIEAYVEQTGGGTATIMVGERHPVTRPSVSWYPASGAEGPETSVVGGKVRVERPDVTEERYELLAGPGWFEGPGWSNARGDLGDLSIGPDDDGEADPIMASPDWTAERIADAIVVLVKNARHLQKRNTRRGDAMA